MMTPPRILLVEDDATMRAVLEATLDHGGLTCEVAQTGVEARERLAGEDYDAVLTDLGLPDGDGTQLIRDIRASSDIPILVVSGRDTEQERITALDLGADDFVGKPFLPGELLARIRAALRRRQGARTGDLASAVFREVRLAPLEKKLFSLLAEREDEVVSNADIISAVWGEEGRGATNLRLLVFTLRRKLEGADIPYEVCNEWGGYRLSRVERATT